MSNSEVVDVNEATRDLIELTRQEAWRTDVEKAMTYGIRFELENEEEFKECMTQARVELTNMSETEVISNWTMRLRAMPELLMGNRGTEEFAWLMGWLLTPRKAKAIKEWMTRGAADYNYRRHQRATPNAWGERTLATFARTTAGVIICGNPLVSYQRSTGDLISPNRDSLELAKRFFPNLDEDVM